MAASTLGITPVCRELAQGSRKGKPQSSSCDLARGGTGVESYQGLYRLCGLVFRPRLYRAVATDRARYRRHAVRRIDLVPRRRVCAAGFPVQFGASAAAASSFACDRNFIGGVCRRPVDIIRGQALAACTRHRGNRCVRAQGTPAGHACAAVMAKNCIPASAGQAARTFRPARRATLSTGA